MILISECLQDSRLLDPKVKTYLPAVGGLTIYTFGDARKLKDEKTEVGWKGARVGSSLYSIFFPEIHGSRNPTVLVVV